MAPVTTRRRKQPQRQAQEDSIPESIFDALNANPPGGRQTEQRDEPKVKEPSVADLMAQIANLNKRVEEQDRTNMALTTAAPQVSQVVLPEEPKLNLEGLPDPLEDGKAYARELGQRTAKYNADLNAYHSAKTAATQQQSGNGDQLWADFSENFGEYADDMEGVEFATTKVLNAAKRRGIDVNKYMYANSDRFFRDVTKAYDDRFGKPGQEEQEQERPAPRRKQASRQDDGEDEEASRTGGIFGGIDGSSSGRRPAAPPPGDMIKDLTDMQRKSGYY